MLSCAILERIEAILRSRVPRRDRDNFRLCDYFDLIGGTSTGAILASCLAIGMKATEVTAFFSSLCPFIFEDDHAASHSGHSFNIEALNEELGAAFVERNIHGELTGIPIRLGSSSLRTGLAIFAKRIDTGEACTITNNPEWAYFDQASARKHGMLEEVAFTNNSLVLADLLLATSASPNLFEDVHGSRALTNHIPGQHPVAGLGDAVFVDGMVSSRAMPGLALMMMTSHPLFGFKWASGEDNLLMTSVGAGWWRSRVTPQITNLAPYTGTQLAQYQAELSLQTVIQDTVRDNIALMQALSTPPSSPRKRWRVDDELIGMEDAMLGTEPLLRFRRMDVALEDLALRKLMGNQFYEVRPTGQYPVQCSARDIETGQAWGEPPLVAKLRRLACGDPNLLELLHEIGTRYGDRMIDSRDFPRSFDLHQDNALSTDSGQRRRIVPDKPLSHPALTGGMNFDKQGSTFRNGSDTGASDNKWF